MFYNCCNVLNTCMVYSHKNLNPDKNIASECNDNPQAMIISAEPCLRIIQDNPHH